MKWRSPFYNLYLGIYCKKHSSKRHLQTPNGTGGHTMSLGTSPIFATLPAPRKPVTLLTPRDQLGLSPDPWMTVPWINHWMPDYVFASFPLLASYSLCLAVGLGHSQSLPSHMVLGGQCQSLSNSQTFVIIAQREAFLSTLSSIANIRHNSLAQHFFSHQSIHPHVVHALGHWKRAKNEAKCNFWRNALSF